MKLFISFLIKLNYKYLCYLMFCNILNNKYGLKIILHYN